MMRYLRKLGESKVDPVIDWREKILRKIDVTISKGQKVLDVGCGDGGDALLFANLGADVIGIDIKPHPNWNLLEQGNLRFKIEEGLKKTGLV